jgi:formylglycine-generating enzyme required for sulfatase activity
MFSAQLIDAKDSKLSGKGGYVRTGVGSGELSRVALALAKQLNGPGRRRSVPAPAWSYPAELDIEMVFVEGGTFTIGCNGTTDAPCQSYETPTRTVTVSSFSMGKYEVTRALWLAVMAGHPTFADPGSWKDDDQLPINYVTWDAVAAFLAKLNELTGKNYRLPTNAEWEYAARGCKAGSCDPYKHSGSDNINDIAWYKGNSGERIHVVGGKKPNKLGIYDMTGNLWEWCQDCYDANYYKNRLTDGNNVNPVWVGCATGSTRVFRGGGHGHDTSIRTRVANMGGIVLGGYPDSGFRVVLSAQ